jgi:hypothetical protein
MSTTFRIGLSVLAMQALVFSTISGADTTPPLSTIIREVVARDDATQKVLHSLQYHQVLDSEQLDKNDKVIKQQEVQMIVRPGASDEIQVVSEKGDNLPENPDEATLQAQGKKAQKQKVNFALKDIVSRFNVAFVGTGTVQNQSVYILSFEPKADQTYHNQTERVLNHLHGRMQVSTRDYTILQTDATLADPVEVAWIFAKVSALDFHYELNNTTGGYAPAQILTSVKVDAPLVTIRQRMKIVITHVEPRTSPAALVTNQ